MTQGQPRDNADLSFDPLHRSADIVQMIAWLTGEPGDVVRTKLEAERRRPGSTVAREYDGPRHVCAPELDAFYSHTSAFVYELAVWNRNLLKSRMRKWVGQRLSASGRPLDVLCMGDGLGFDSLHLARQGHRVTFFELPGLTERFARELFARSDVNVTVLTDRSLITCGSFDAITCFDVLEHVSDPAATVRWMRSQLRAGGLLYVSAPFYMIHRAYPTHLRANRRHSGSMKLYTDSGLELAGGVWTWHPLVFQAPGDGKLRCSRLTRWKLRLTGAVLALGRWTALPFRMVHLVRRLTNRPFH